MSGVVTAIGAAVAGAVVSSALAPKPQQAPKAPDPIAPIAPTVMPTPDSQAVLDAQKKSMLDQAARGGRASTVLTDQSGDKLGG